MSNQQELSDANAASAAVVAVERGASGVYNIVDDEPAPQHVWLPVLADVPRRQATEARPRQDRQADRRRRGGEPHRPARGASNAKAKRELGWQPRYASWRQGFRKALG